MPNIANIETLAALDAVSRWFETPREIAQIRFLESIMRSDDAINHLPSAAREWGSRENDKRNLIYAIEGMPKVLGHMIFEFAQDVPLVRADNLYITCNKLQG